MTTKHATAFIIALRVAIIVALLAPFTGCQRVSHLTTTAAGHLVHASIEGPYSVRNEPACTTITTKNGSICIERSRVLFNGILWVRSPEGASETLKLGKNIKSIVIESRRPASNSSIHDKSQIVSI
jgi:hypothetical protein